MKKPKSKKNTPEYILASIEASTVFGKKKNITPKRMMKEEPYRSDNGRKIPSLKTNIHNTLANQETPYSGELELNVGLGYNKGGLQVLLKKELKDAGKKTSQLE